MAQWTAATTLQRFAEILEQEMEQNPLTNEAWAKELSVAGAIDIFKERIVKDAMTPEARHKDKAPKPPKPVEKPEGE